uniref:Ig-like domain-containing protein n=1 Tax=Chrysemys picta bellii TaxID=8478 RepID=A0A8C3HYG3_CHRPI
TRNLLSPVLCLSPHLDRQGGPYPKPSISVSPGGVIPVGGNVTIRCRNQHLGMKFLLYKAGVGNYLTYTDPAGSEAEFPITSARREQSGNYTCRYSHRTGPAAYSEPSDPVQIIVAGEGYPKPSISLRPSGGVAPGGAVTIRCRGSHQNVRFHLYKDGNPNALQDMEPAGDVTEFPIHSVSWRDAGSYSCYYHKKSNRFIWSHPSDPVELVVAEESYPKPSISVSPGGVIPMGGNVTIRYRHQCLGMRFLLYKAGDGNYPNYTDPAGSEAEFPITSARREHGGSYTCRYSNRTDPAAYSEPSDPVQIIVAGHEFLKPTIWVRPSRVVALGGSVTIRCAGLYPGMEFFLRKAGQPNPQVRTVPDGTVAEFPIPSVRSSRCQYSTQLDPPIWSHPSDSVELVVAGERPVSWSESKANSADKTSAGPHSTLRCSNRNIGTVPIKAGHLVTLLRTANKDATRGWLKTE